MMKKSSPSWILLLMVVVATLFLPFYALDAAEVIPADPQAKPPVVNPAKPEQDAGLEAEVPDLFVQEPNVVAGWCCWGDWQCVEIHGPGYACYTRNTPCGYCY